jgi:hypothetical protein
LPSSHAYALGHPIASSGSPSYVTDTPFGTGKAIDLSNGHVEVSTGGTEDVFDGGSKLSVSAWVKGWPEKAYAPFVSKGASFATPKAVDSLRLWLDAGDLSTMDQGTSLGAIGPPVANGNNVKFWADKSGNNYHATSSNSPTYTTDSINGLAAINTAGDWFTIADSATAFDAWDTMTVVLIWKWGGGDYWHAGLRKHSAANGNNQVTGWSFDRMNVGANQATGMWWGNGSAAKRLTGNANMNAYDPKIITIRYDGSVPRMAYYTNGANYRQTTSAVVSSFVTNTSALSLGNKYHWGELLIYRNALSDADRELAEAYLAHKWVMSGFLPSSHVGSNLNGWSVTRGSTSNGLGTILTGVGGAASGSSSTKK